MYFNANVLLCYFVFSMGKLYLGTVYSPEVGVWTVGHTHLFVLEQLDILILQKETVSHVSLYERHKYYHLFIHSPLTPLGILVYPLPGIPIVHAVLPFHPLGGHGGGHQYRIMCRF